MPFDSTDEKLQNTPPFRCNPDGIVRVWAYIGDDDPTSGASHGAMALARLVAEKLNVQMLYVDEAMLAQSFPHTKSVAAQLEKLLAREGQPDILIGQTSEKMITKTGTTPTIMIDNNLPTLAKNMFSKGTMAEIVPHHVTPEILQQAGQEFQARHPELKHPLTAIFTTMIQPTRNEIRMLANTCLSTGGSFYLCPSTRRTDKRYYAFLTKMFSRLIEKSGQSDIGSVTAATIDETCNKYNPYLGLLDQADHVILLGESRSIVSEAIVRGRPIHVNWQSTTSSWPPEQRYSALEQSGHLKYIYGHPPGTPLDSTYLAPLNSTPCITDHIVRAFDHTARMRTLQPGLIGLQNPCTAPITSAKGPA